MVIYKDAQRAELRDVLQHDRVSFKTPNDSHLLLISEAALKAF